MILQTVTVGDYQANLLKLKCGNHIGYQYRIYTKVNGKRTCVCQNYAYLWDKEDCYNRMMNDLHSTMGIVKDLFHGV